MVCSVCGTRLEGGGTMRADYYHPTEVVAACSFSVQWAPITERQLVDELTALRECVKAADALFNSSVEISESDGADWKEKLAYRIKRAKVTLP